MTETAEPAVAKPKRKPKGTAPKPERLYHVFEAKATTEVADYHGGTAALTVEEGEGSFVGVPSRFVRIHTRARKQVVEDVWS